MALNTKHETFSRHTAGNTHALSLFTKLYGLPTKVFEVKEFRSLELGRSESIDYESEPIYEGKLLIAGLFDTHTETYSAIDPFADDSEQIRLYTDLSLELPQYSLIVTKTETGLRQLKIDKVLSKKDRRYKYFHKYLLVPVYSENEVVDESYYETSKLEDEVKPEIMNTKAVVKDEHIYEEVKPPSVRDKSTLGKPNIEGFRDNNTGTFKGRLKKW